MSADPRPVDEDGVARDHVAPSPQPVSWAVRPYGHQTVSPSETVPVFEVTFHTSTGTTVLYLPAPALTLLADQLRSTAASGLTIAHDLEGIDP